MADQWSVESGDGEIVVADASNRALCVVYPDGGETEEECERVARLIAAAPDLLAALELCVNLLGDLGQEDTSGYPVFQQARAAISKARGETP